MARRRGGGAAGGGGGGAARPAPGRPAASPTLAQATGGRPGRAAPPPRPTAPRLGLGLNLGPRQRGAFQQAVQGGQGGQFLANKPWLQQRIGAVNPTSARATRIQNFMGTGQPQPLPRPPQGPPRGGGGMIRPPAPQTVGPLFPVNPGMQSVINDRTGWSGDNAAMQPSLGGGQASTAENMQNFGQTTYQGPTNFGGAYGGGMYQSPYGGGLQPQQPPYGGLRGGIPTGYGGQGYGRSVFGTQMGGALNPGQGSGRSIFGTQMGGALNAQMPGGGMPTGYGGGPTLGMAGGGQRTGFQSPTQWTPGMLGGPGGNPNPYGGGFI